MDHQDKQDGLCAARLRDGPMAQPASLDCATFSMIPLDSLVGLACNWRHSAAMEGILVWNSSQTVGQCLHELSNNLFIETWTWTATSTSNLRND